MARKVITYLLFRMPTELCTSRLTVRAVENHHAASYIVEGFLIRDLVRTYISKFFTDGV